MCPEGAYVYTMILPNGRDVDEPPVSFLAWKERDQLKQFTDGFETLMEPSSIGNWPEEEDITFFDFTLDSTYGFMSNKNIDSPGNFQFTITMPNQLPFKVLSLIIQKKNHYFGWTLLTSDFKISYISGQTGLLEDYNNGDWIPTGQLAEDEKSFQRKINLEEPFIATIVYLKLRSIKQDDPDYAVIRVDGRFDIEIQQTWNFTTQITGFQGGCRSGQQTYNDYLNIGNNPQQISPSSIIEFQGSEYEYICGQKSQFITSENEWNFGIHGFAASKCKITCKSDLTASTSIEPIQLAQSEGQMTIPIFPDYFQTLNSHDCPILNCKVFTGCDSGSPIISENSKISILDNSQLIVDRETAYDVQVCLGCENKFGFKYTPIFQVNILCSDPTIELPEDIEQVQVYLATIESTQRASFKFSPFKIDPYGCPIYEYRVYKSNILQEVPIGLDLNNPIVVGSESTFEIPVIDYENPSSFNFVIQALATGGYQFTSPELSLRVECPNSPQIYLVNQYATYKATFVGAVGSDATFVFPKSISELPRCSFVIGYEIIPKSEMIIYPSPTCGDPCLEMNIDVSSEGMVQFQVKPILSSGEADLSPTIRIEVFDEAQSPKVLNNVLGTVTQKPDHQNFMLEQVSKFKFYPFQCSTGCNIINYEVFESELSLLQPTGLGAAILNSDSGELEISVDSSSLQDFSFVVRAEVEGFPQINAFSNPLRATIECGSEEILISQSKLVLEALERNSGIFTYFEFKTIFSSSKSLCDLVVYELTQEDPSISMDESYNIVIDTTQSFKRSVFIKGSSQKGKFNILELQVVVCGNEDIQSINTPDRVFMLSDDDDEITIQPAEYQSYFQTTFQSQNSALRCTEIQSYSIVKCSPDDDISFFNLDEVLTIESRIQFSQNLCIQASTLGGKSATHIQKIEVKLCSQQEIILESQGPKKIQKVYSRQNQKETIDIEMEGFSYKTSESCPVKNFKLLDQNKQEYIGNQLEIQNQNKILVRTDNPIQQIFYIQASSDHGVHNEELEIEITVCGYEQVSLIGDSKKSITLSKTLSYYRVDNDIKSHFENNNTENCPIDKYQVYFKNQSEISSQNRIIKLKGQLILILPSNTDQNITQEIIDLIIKATTIGQQEQEYAISITLIGTKIDQELMDSVVQVNNSAAFQQAGSQIYEFYIEVTQFQCIPMIQSQVVTILDMTTSIKDSADDETKEIIEVFIPALKCKFPFDADIGYINLNCNFDETIYFQKLLKMIQEGKQISPIYLIEIFIQHVALNLEMLDSENIASCSVDKYADQDLQTIKNLEALQQIAYQPLFSQIKEQQEKKLDQEVQTNEIVKIKYSLKKTKLKQLHIEQQVKQHVLIIEFSAKLQQLSSLEFCKHFNISLQLVEMDISIQGLCKQQFSNLSSKPEFQIELLDQQDEKIFVGLTYLKPQKISSSSDGLRDKIMVRFVQNEEMRDVNFQTLDPQIFKEFYFVKVPPVIIDKQAQKQMQTISGCLLVIAIPYLIKALMKTGDAQKVWSLLNSLQIISHMALLKASATAPYTIGVYNKEVLRKFNQQDKYPMDQITKNWFGNSQSQYQQLEDLGYQGSNFIIIIGPVIINLTIMCAIFLIKALVNTLAIRFYKNEIARKIGMKIKQKSIMAEIYNFLQLSWINILIAIFLGAIYLKYDEPNQRFTTLIWLICIIVVILCPILAIFKILKNIHEIDTLENYNFIFQQLKTNSAATTLFNFISLTRKTLFVLILFTLHEHPCSQLLAHMSLTLVYACLLAQLRPFLSKNNLAIGIECIIWVSSLILLLLNLDMDHKMFLAALYILVSSSGLNYQIYCMVLEMIGTIPKKWEKLRQDKKEQTYEKWIRDSWLKSKVDKAKENPQDQILQKVSKHAELIVAIRDNQVLHNDLFKDLSSQVQWLKENDITDRKVMDPLREKIKELRRQISIDKIELERQNQKCGIIMGNSFGGIRQLKYSEYATNRQRSQFSYHQADPPNDEDRLQSKVVKPFLKQNKLSSQEDMDQFQQRILEKKVKNFNNICLNNFLSAQNFKVHEIIPDGNCGPRAIAVAIYGDQNLHQRVRQELCQFLLCNPDYWGEIDGQAKYNHYVESQLSKDGCWLSDMEFKALAKLYDWPIVIFSAKCATPYFDFILSGMINVQEKVPIYLYHQNENHFDLLIQVQEEDQEILQKIDQQQQVEVKLKKMKKQLKVFRNVKRSKVMQTIQEE